MPADLDKQLDRVSQYRNTLNATAWTVAGIFFAASGVLLNAVAQQLARPKAGLAISLAGLASAAIWNGLVRRTIRYLALSEVIIERLERELDVPAEFCLSYDRNRTLHEMMLTGSLAARPILIGASGLAMFGWLLAIGFFMFRLGAFAPGAH